MIHLRVNSKLSMEEMELTLKDRGLINDLPVWRNYHTIATLLPLDDGTCSISSNNTHLVYSIPRATGAPWVIELLVGFEYTSNMIKNFGFEEIAYREYKRNKLYLKLDGEYATSSIEVKCRKLDVHRLISRIDKYLEKHP